jgi:hypothetical protein
MTFSPWFLGLFPMTRFLFTQEPWLIVLLSYSRWEDRKIDIDPKFYFQSFLIGRPSLGCPAEPAVPICTGGFTIP